MSQRQQKPRAVKPNEAETFHLWVISDAHVATDKAVSAAIRNGMEFTPPAAYPESLASALRQSESGGDLGGPPFRWDVALDLGDNAGLWDLPDDEQGREVARQFGVLRHHRREQIYSVAGNHDASRGTRRLVRASRQTGGFASGSIRWVKMPRHRVSTRHDGHLP